MFDFTGSGNRAMANTSSVLLASLGKEKQYILPSPQFL